MLIKLELEFELHDASLSASLSVSRETLLSFITLVIGWCNRRLVPRGTPNWGILGLPIEFVLDLRQVGWKSPP